VRDCFPLSSPPYLILDVGRYEADITQSAAKSLAFSLLDKLFSLRVLSPGDFTALLEDTMTQLDDIQAEFKDVQTFVTQEEGATV
jgi:hypothetical protein